MLFLGGLGAFGIADLPGELDILSNPAVLITAGVIYVVESFANKIPGIDSSWDAAHTFIRIPVGALLAGSVAAGSHATKAGARAAINASPEFFTNWAASISEDVLVVGGLSLALFHPVVFFGFSLLFLVFAIWLLPKFWRMLQRLVTCLTGDGAASETALSASGTKGFSLSLNRRDPE